MELTLNEVISKAGRGIDVVRAVVDINVERNGSHYYHSSASILIKRPHMVHLKMYNFGMLAGDVVVKGDEVHVLYGRMNKGFEAFIKEFYNTVFWWDGVGDGYMYEDNNMYIIRTDNRELYLDSATLLPVKQSVRVEGRMLYITYEMPSKEGDFWYPSFIEIRMNEYRFTVKVERFFINPPLGERDFMPLQSSIQG